jgi:antitoxin HigA-1
MGRPAIHPGEHLAEELKALGMSAAELARQMQVPTNRVTEILNGQRALTGDTALRLGHFFGTSPEFWLNLHSLYEQRLKNKRSVQAGGGSRPGCAAIASREEKFPASRNEFGWSESGRRVGQLR